MILLFSSRPSLRRSRSASSLGSTNRAVTWQRITDKMQSLALNRPRVADELLRGIESALDQIIVVEPTLEVDDRGRPVRDVPHQQGALAVDRRL